jgi:prophage regulatory protein
MHPDTPTRATPNHAAHGGPSFRYLRLPEVLHLTGLSKTRLYVLLDAGAFPASASLHGRAVAWRSDEIETWMTSRPRVTRRHNNAPAEGTAEAPRAHART